MASRTVAAMTRRNFFIPAELYKALQSRAVATGAPMSELVRRALEDFLKQKDA